MPHEAEVISLNLPFPHPLWPKLTYLLPPQKKTQKKEDINHKNIFGEGKGDAGLEEFNPFSDWL